jgi:hypothetical protein
MANGELQAITSNDQGRRTAGRRDIVRYFLVAIIVASLLGCVPNSDSPLTDRGEQNIDTSILGTWFWKDENESGYIHIGLDEDLNLLRFVMAVFDKDGELDTSQFSGHTSSLDEKRYLNLCPANDPGGYMFVKYSVNHETLSISLMDTDPVKQAITNGSLNGEVIKEQWSSSIHITEEQNKLQQFILHNDKALFPETKCFQKLKAPGDPLKQEMSTKRKENER